MPSKVLGRVGSGTVAASPFTIGTVVNTGRAEVRFAPVQIAHQSWINPLAIVTNAVVTAKTGAALPAAAGTVTFLPDGAQAAGFIFPRNAVVTVTHGSSVVAASGVIAGLDEYGTAITEAWSVTATGTSKVYTGVKAFARVTSITYVTAADASANTIIVGTGKTLGLNFACSCASPVKEVAGGSVVTTGVLVAASTAATADSRGTYTPAATLDGAIDFEIWTLCNDVSA